MPIVLRHPLAVCLLAAGLGAAGCGDDGGGGTAAGTAPAAPTAAPTATTPAPDPARPVPTAAFTFGPDGLTPALARVTLGAERVVALTLTATDGRPHAAVVTVGGRRSRLVLMPGRSAGTLLRGVRPGRYRVVPDGAAAPVTLVVTAG